MSAVDGEEAEVGVDHLPSGIRYDDVTLHHQDLSGYFSLDQRCQVTSNGPEAGCQNSAVILQVFVLLPVYSVSCFRGGAWSCLDL